MTEPAESLLGAHVFRALLVSGILAPPFSVLLLLLYRHRVVRAMRFGGTLAPSNKSAPRTNVTNASPSQPLQIGPEQRHATAVSPEAEQLTTAALRRPLATAALYGAAGIVGCLVISVAYLRVGNFSLNPMRLLGVWVVAAWPVVLVFNVVAATTAATRLLSVGAYIAAMVLVWALGGASATEIGALWSIQNALPTVVFVASLNRTIRAVGPMVLAFVTVMAVGLEYALAALSDPGAQLNAISKAAAWAGLNPNNTILATILTSLAICGVVGWFVSRGLGFLYSHKKVSDQSVTLDALWLLFFTWSAIVIAAHDVRWLPIGVLAFVILKAADITGRRVLMLRRNGIASARPRRALLLRAFSRSSQNEKLIDALAKHWRYIGSLLLFTGPDLATTTVKPHDFLDFLSGRLRRRFITTTAALERHLAQLDEQPDPDGRFRINDFFCYEDTWQMVVRRLVKEVDATIIDLRGFTGAQTGCVFEIQLVINTVPLERVVTVVDRTTNEPAVLAVAVDAWANLDVNSPNAGCPSPLLRVWRVDKGTNEVRPLLRAICGAAAPRPVSA